MLVEVLYAHNGIQHQQKHTITPHSSVLLLAGSIPRAHTRIKPCNQGLAIAHARNTPHKPHKPSQAQLCSMSAPLCHSLPRDHARHEPATPNGNVALLQPGMRARVQRHGPRRTRQHAKDGATPSHARGLLLLQHTPAANLPRAPDECLNELLKQQRHHVPAGPCPKYQTKPRHSPVFFTTPTAPTAKKSKPGRSRGAART